jgi:nicotinamide-nucleotide amidase
LVSVGDEVLAGVTLNTNASWIGQRCAAEGWFVARCTVVGDRVDEINAAVRDAVAHGEVVVITGGLGPTVDDRTAEALASLITDQDLDSAVPIADIPNPVGSALGLRMRLGGVSVYSLPGVPSEMRAMFDQTLVPELHEIDASSGHPSRAVRSLRTVLTSELVIANALAPIESSFDGAIAYLPAAGEVVVRFTSDVGGQRGLDEVETAESQARALLGDVVVGPGEQSLAEVVIEVLRSASATVATAESLTGGAVAVALTDVAGASDVYRGSVVAYATELKASVLAVDAALLAERGAVDEDVARQMATGVRERLGATFGVSTTGVAGPDPQDGVPPGVVFVAVAGSEGVVVRRLALRGDREGVRRRTVVNALALLRSAALGVDK